MLRLKVYNLNQGLVIYWVCFNVCDWIYFLLKFLLYSDDAYTAICLKILFSVFPIFASCFAFRWGVAWSKLTKVMPINLLNAVYSGICF